MAIPKKGSRKFTVDGITYRWLIRRKPTYGQGIQGGMNIAIEQIAAKDTTTLVTWLARNRPDNWIVPNYTSISPADIENYIRTAIKQGWKSDEAGKTFIVSDLD
jgi:hypothetical protein